MRMTSRAAWALGLSLVGVAALVGPTRGQQDANVQRSNNQGAAANRPAGPSVVATLDVYAVLDGYKKMKFRDEELKAEAASKQRELTQLVAQGKQVAKEMESFQPGTEDFKKREAQLTELQVKLQSRQEQLKHEFSGRKAEIIAEAYQEIQAMAKGVAQKKGLTQVLRVENSPAPATEFEMALQLIARPVVYSDPANDITQLVLYNLNRLYDQKTGGGSGPAPTSATGPNPAAGGAAPARSAAPTRSAAGGGATTKRN